MDSNNQEIPYAGFWRRVASYFLDWIFIFPFLVITVSGFYVVLILPAIAMLALTITNIFFYFRDGQTIGKKILNIKIISTKTGEKPSALALIGRFFGKIISALPLCLGLLWIGWDDRKQGWHDKMASTTVVRFDKNKWSNLYIKQINIGIIASYILLIIIVALGLKNSFINIITNEVGPRGTQQINKILQYEQTQKGVPIEKIKTLEQMNIFELKEFFDTW